MPWIRTSTKSHKCKYKQESMIIYRFQRKHRCLPNHKLCLAQAGQVKSIFVITTIKNGQYRIKFLLGPGCKMHVWHTQYWQEVIQETEVLHVSKYILTFWPRDCNWISVIFKNPCQVGLIGVRSKVSHCLYYCKI